MRTIYIFMWVNCLDKVSFYFFLKDICSDVLKIIIPKLFPRESTKAQDKIPNPRWSGDTIFVRKILNFHTR